MLSVGYACYGRREAIKVLEVSAFVPLPAFLWKSSYIHSERTRLHSYDPHVHKRWTDVRSPSFLSRGFGVEGHAAMSTAISENNICGHAYMCNEHMSMKSVWRELPISTIIEKIICFRSGRPRSQCVTRQRQKEAGFNAESLALHERALQRIPYHCSDYLLSWPRQFSQRSIRYQCLDRMA